MKSLEAEVLGDHHALEKARPSQAEAWHGIARTNEVLQAEMLGNDHPLEKARPSQAEARHGISVTNEVPRGRGVSR
jgi:hypothetical protein